MIWCLQEYPQGSDAPNRTARFIAPLTDKLLLKDEYDDFLYDKPDIQDIPNDTVGEIPFYDVYKSVNLYEFKPYVWALYRAAYEFGYPCSAEWDSKDRTIKYLDAVNISGDKRRYEVTIGSWENVRFVAYPGGE